jgi:hypothetical protein
VGARFTTQYTPAGGSPGAHLWKNAPSLSLRDSDIYFPGKQPKGHQYPNNQCPLSERDQLCPIVLGSRWASTSCVISGRSFPFSELSGLNMKKEGILMPAVVCVNMLCTTHLCMAFTLS